jgi:membrane-associated phospholipid phosphatase
MIWLIFLGISTLTTYQHHSIDIITGSILAHLSFVIFPYRKNDFLYRNFQVANIYFLSGWILILAALLLNEFWEALAVFIVAGSDESQYRASIPKKQHLFLKDQNGNIPWFKKVLYAPYLLIYWVFWKFFRKNKIPVEILPGLYISSRPDAEDLKNFGNIDSLKVYDLSAEMEEISMIKEHLNYHSVFSGYRFF